MGGDAYPSPCTMASSDKSKPPVQSVPVTEHKNFPAKPIAAYIPDSKIKGKFSQISVFSFAYHIYFFRFYNDSWHKDKEQVAGKLLF